MRVVGEGGQGVRGGGGAVRFGFIYAAMKSTEENPTRVF